MGSCSSTIELHPLGALILWALQRIPQAGCARRGQGPAHRVVNADGRLGGYGGGVWRKQFLLDLERGQGSITAPAAVSPPVRPSA
ncbi:MAG TPA: MGMT family protein [Steroidobacteraceae bacterium]|nr:MGMT family protein [Steroidobacteraceae bacterium]